MAIMFIKGDKDRFLTTVGVHYGFLMVEDHKNIQSRLVICLDQGKKLLHQAVEQGLCTADEATTAEEAMAKSGMAQNMSDVYTNAKTYTMPKDYHPAHSFKICHRCTVPIPHGHIYNEDGDKVESVITLEKGLFQCIGMASDDNVHVLDCVSLFQQMYDANLLHDEQAILRFVNDLPADKLRELDIFPMEMEIAVIIGNG